MRAARRRTPTTLGRVAVGRLPRAGAPRLDDLAQRIEPARGVGRPGAAREPQRRRCARSRAHVRQRRTVYETWGFAAQGARGLGISALFAGPSGTGKTLAAEVLADELRLDLYRIDLQPGGQQVHRRDREEPAPRLRRRRGRRRDPALRRGRRAVRQAQRGARTATTATPTSRSATCCSGWRRTAAWRS